MSSTPADMGTALHECRRCASALHATALEAPAHLEQRYLWCLAMESCAHSTLSNSSTEQGFLP